LLRKTESTIEERLTVGIGNANGDVQIPLFVNNPGKRGGKVEPEAIVPVPENLRYYGLVGKKRNLIKLTVHLHLHQGHVFSIGF
jgi:hypothetical protein